MNFYPKIENKLSFYFVPGIILDHFGYRKSIFRYPKLKILWNFGKCVFDNFFFFNKSTSRFKKQKNLRKTWKNL